MVHPPGALAVGLTPTGKNAGCGMRVKYVYPPGALAVGLTPTGTHIGYAISVARRAAAVTVTSEKNTSSRKRSIQRSTLN